MNPCVSPPVFCTSCELLVVVSPGPLSHTSLSSEPPCLERGNTQFALILSARQCMQVFHCPFMHVPLPSYKAEEHSRSAELRLQMGLEVSLWLLSPRMLNNSLSHIFPYFFSQTYIYFSGLPVPFKSPGIICINRICLSLWNGHLCGCLPCLL